MLLTEGEFMTDYIKKALKGTKDYHEVLLAAVTHALTNTDVPVIDGDYQEIEDLIKIEDNGHGCESRVIRLDGYCFRCSFWLNQAIKKNGIEMSFYFWGKIKAGEFCPRCARDDRWNGIERKDGNYRTLSQIFDEVT